MGLDVVISESLLSALQEKADNWQDKLTILSNKIGEDARKNAVLEAPHKTGNLEQHMKLDSTGPYSSVVYPDENASPYALFVILGTGPHLITGNPWLSWPGAKHPVRSVMHPGTAANPFLDRASDLTESDAEDRLAEFEAWVNDI